MATPDWASEIEKIAPVDLAAVDPNWYSSRFCQPRIEFIFAPVDFAPVDYGVRRYAGATSTIPLEGRVQFATSLDIARWRRPPAPTPVPTSRSTVPSLRGPSTRFEQRRRRPPAIATARPPTANGSDRCAEAAPERAGAAAADLVSTVARRLRQINAQDRLSAGCGARAACSKSPGPRRRAQRAA